MYVVLFLSSVCPTVMQAGQVYGVSLSGPLLAKTGLYPEQKNCGEDFRNKWIEASCLCHLSSQLAPFIALVGHSLTWGDLSLEKGLLFKLECSIAAKFQYLEMFS
jgi:hypothetical protein